MPKYLIKVSYTSEGAKGILKSGGSERRKAASQALESVGGKLDALYFAFGDTDAYAICDAPDNTAAAAASLAINATGLLHTTTIVLMTPEEVDQAAKVTVKYRAPGQ